MKLSHVAQAVGLACISMQVVAQTTPAPVPAELEKVEITGSSIKRTAAEGALPLQVITRQELDKAGIVSAEQLLSIITANGNGSDNLASNADVTGGANRGNNGLSAANLRGQGSNSTLVLLNGRRMASHGLSGSVVDLNSIPMGAVQRVEILKDGASAVYGADAVGGVINFVLRKDFTGLEIGASTNITQEGGGSISRVSLLGGFGDLAKDRFNLLGSLSHRKNQLLAGSQRDFVNTFQPDRGLSVDTRGTPFATAVPITSTPNALSSFASATATSRTNGRGPAEPGGTIARSGGINVLDLPGQPGCKSIDGMDAYDELLWDFPGAKFACAWDTGRAAAIQQPVTNTNGVLRGNYALTPDITLIGEAVLAQTTTRKIFSNNQISSSNSTASPFYRLTYPSSAPAYNRVFNALAAAFPSIEGNRGLGITYRWRCIGCGPRQIETDSSSQRVLLALEGTQGTWDYRVGVSRASSDVSSVLGGGYYYNDKFAPLLRSGTLNPFLFPGEAQTDAAVQALAAASATGAKLYGGKTSITQIDASVSGPVAKMGAGDLLVAVGVDKRTEKFAFNGNASDVATQTNIFNAPFDAVNTLDGVSRSVTAVYAEAIIPVLKELELSAAIRHDRYSGFGGTTNPKVSFKYVPVKEFLARGSYNTSFRVPTFAQQFYGVTEEPYSGKDLVDPLKCPSLVVSSTNLNCASISPTTLFGGKANLKPETAKQWSLGFVVQPFAEFSANVDYWQITRENEIKSPSALDTLLPNYQLFPDNFIRDAAGNLVTIDERWINSGGATTKGVEIGFRYNTNVSGGKFGVSMDGTLMLSRKTKLLSNSIPGDNEVGRYSYDADIPVRWKHNLTVSYSRGAWAGSLGQSYTSGYLDRVAPGIENGTVTPINYKERVSAWVSYDLSLTYTGIKNLAINMGIKNLFNKAPPFSAAYDSNSGAGSSWEPRIADPRGRAFLVGGTYSFK